MKGTIKDIGLTLSGELSLTLTLPRQSADELKPLMDAPVSVDIKKWRERRSLDANALCWALCRDIGKAVKLPDIEVYRRAVRDAGEYEHLPIKAVAVDTFIRRWQSRGIGWFVDVIDDSKLKGYKLVKVYYGSSSYNTQEMSRLIDWLVDECAQMDIPLPATKEQVEEAKRRWGDA